MPVTDIKQLFNYENNVELATQAILAAGGYHDAFIQGSTEKLPASRIEITFATGEATNEAVIANGDHVYDTFTGRLSLRIVSNRARNQPSLLAGVSRLHEEWCAGVRSLLQERVNPFTTANLPYYKIHTIRPLATLRDLDPMWMEDYTRLDYHIELGVRSDAWPI